MPRARTTVPRSAYDRVRAESERRLADLRVAVQRAALAAARLEKAEAETQRLRDERLNADQRAHALEQQLAETKALLAQWVERFERSPLGRLVRQSAGLPWPAAIWSFYAAKAASKGEGK